MSIPPDSLSASMEQAPLPVLPIERSAPRFCRTCGTQWQSGWVDCLPCTQQQAKAHAQPLNVTIEWRAMKSALWFYFSLLAVCAVGLGLSRAFGGATLEMSLAAALSLLTIGWCCACARDVIGPLRRVPGVGWFCLALGLSLVTFAIADGVIHTLHVLLNVPEQSMSKPFLQAGYGWFTVVLVICVQPAVFEELAFRGVIFAALTKALSGTETILVSAMMFMILHLSPARFPHTFALGIGAGYLRYRTKSIYPGMLMHFAHNFLCIAGEYLSHSQ